MPTYNASGWSYNDSAPVMWTINPSHKTINDIGKGNLYIRADYPNKLRLSLKGVVSTDFIKGLKFIDSNTIPMTRILI
jgi:hypothetical protein